MKHFPNVENEFSFDKVDELATKITQGSKHGQCDDAKWSKMSYLAQYDKF